MMLFEVELLVVDQQQIECQKSVPVSVEEVVAYWKWQEIVEQ
jgi:hypothetical protein